MRDFEFKIARKVVGLKYRDGGKNQKKLKNSADTQNDKFHPSSAALKRTQSKKWGVRYGLGGQINKNVKGHKKLRQRAQNSGQTQGIKRNSVKLTIIQF